MELNRESMEELGTSGVDKVAEEAVKVVSSEVAKAVGDGDQLGD